MRPPASLAIAALSHRYPGASVAALHEVGFRVAPGERVGLLGPNGAGKSTLMRLCCGYLPVQRGPGTSLQVGGVEVAADSLRVRQMVGYLPEQVPLYPELRVREHLEFRAAIKGVRGRGRAAELGRVAERTGLGHMLEVPIQQLSRGYRQRVGIADALLGAPPLVVLDEPTVGLDPNQVLDIRAMLRALGGAQTLIFSSHILAEVEALCDRVVILAGGRCVADESVAEALRTSDVVVAWIAAVAPARSVLGAALAEIGALGRSACVDDGRASGDPRSGAELAGGTGGLRAHEARGELADGTGGLRTKAGELADGTGGLRVGVVEARGELAQVVVTCPSGQVAEALMRAIGGASARAGLPLVRLELGRRRLEERFARVTGAVAEA
ncbi:MAG: ATP-binding cassette domain-containing protein [Nannocystis sp.]|nr:ATP-binding cassette domain-containing protein [Nannocystis sp.]